MESAVMTSALMSSQSAVGNQQMKRSEKDEATSCWRISSWFSVDDVIGDVIIFSRWFERAVARISRCYLEIAIAKRCRLHKLIRQRFALALKIQQMLFTMRKFSRDFSQEKPADMFFYRTGFSFDELSGCASLGQMPSFYFRCAVRSLGARLSDKYMGRDRRRKNLSCSLYWFFIDLSNSVARVI
ncbi:protein POLAR LOCALIZATION DURING ASYMMETRIC DIVISION AND REDISTRIBUTION-like [Dorcoceras hygrometricum]|uniref:Protein POLAR LOCALIZATION DURING ASYMMETRIC DIVISION AND REDISTRIBUTION-like n=1 Tax=Dorcoceras hygrometricum TaxID=472368 RepID=A0A2Z7A6H4_9LAMI|nr:protein POLAR LOCALIZATION DURING ASYMMETRIC DIVISION AND REDISTRIBUTION-like [Dorcoceras hygrometricum]